MHSTATRHLTDAPTTTPPRARWRRAWPAVWPAALAVLIAAGTAYGLDDPREVAPVVAASGLVYLAAAAVGRRWMSWVAFGVTFALITLDKLTGIDATAMMIAVAAAFVVVGLVARRVRPWWALALQTAAMVVLGAISLVAVELNPTVGGLLVAAALLGHAVWDLHHHRTNRVVSRSLAEFCAVLDTLVAIAVGVVAVSA
jgi:hypothetical protein